MTDETKLLIQYAWMPYLGSLIAEHGPLSPFVDPPATAPSKELMLEMWEAGILAKPGVLSNQASRMLCSVASASAAAEFTLFVEDSSVEHQVYFADGGSAPVAMANGADGIHLRSPAPCDEIVETTAEFSGSSALSFVPLEVELSIGEALVALVFVDLERKSLHRALAEEEEPSPVTRDAGEIQLNLQRQNLDSAWLVWLQQQLLPAPVSMTEKEVTAALKSLVAKGLLVENPRGFTCGQILGHTAMRLLLLKAYYHLSAARSPSSGLDVRVEFGIVQNGIHDLMLIEAVSDRVRLTGIAGRALLAMLNDFLTSADALAGLEPPIPGSSAAGPPRAGGDRP